ncbi:glycerophosphodiester phosphodiesterase [Gimesia panareensis]|uniref:Glycerophosphoryl diester phosphodiesterase n=1 Tax=Gimesia panareensis TaxID=2527978 RepID=A0A518A922_9PLAN|nr:glycerophosphodiester phosphodiesterase [Gimesia panareensis]QDT28359.1 Glycerophosphoryl diester phosphodiesterase [Gimesia panareensis]QDU51227.1 Glycerophosphoryl diester phosphodiesterase [Gimesia panareensis]
MSLVPFTRQIATSLNASLRHLIGADMLYKLLAFVVLTPLFAILFRTLLALGGQSVLTDVDIALFFAGPFGWICAITLGAVWLTIVALEQASLLSILATRASGQKPEVIESLRFAASHVADILHVTGKMIGWSLLVLAPFLLIAGGVYLGLLGEYDINYYLNERPTEFKVAVGLGVILGLVLTGILLRLFSGWFLALPLILFDKVPPAEGLQASQRKVAGHRRQILIWLIAWLGMVLILNALLVAFVGLAGRVLIPTEVGSLLVLTTRVGLMLLVLFLTGLTLNLFATIAFAGLLFQGYQQMIPEATMSVEKSESAETQSGSQLFTRGRLATAAIVGVLGAAFLGYWSLQSTLEAQQIPQVMAHRGASKAAPENSMAAFRQAIADGADWIELDVQETVDGKVVVVHDSDLMKLAGNPLKIWDATLEDLTEIDIGSSFDPQFAAERVPTLAEVLKLCKDKIGVIIELKYYGHDQQLEQRVADIVESEGMADQIMVMSLKPEGIAKMKALRPDWKCGLLLSVHAGDLENIKADFLAVNAKFATRSFVNRAHNAEKDVYVWTVDDPTQMLQLMNRGVDGILTNRPALARKVIHEREEMKPAERLLAEISLLFNQPPTDLEQ